MKLFAVDENSLLENITIGDKVSVGNDGDGTVASKTENGRCNIFRNSNLINSQNVNKAATGTENCPRKGSKRMKREI